MVEVSNSSNTGNNGSNSVFDPLDQEDMDLTYPWSEPTPSCSETHQSQSIGLPFSIYNKAKEIPFFLQLTSKINPYPFFNDEGSNCMTAVEPTEAPYAQPFEELPNVETDTGDTLPEIPPYFIHNYTHKYLINRLELSPNFPIEQTDPSSAIKVVYQKNANTNTLHIGWTATAKVKAKKDDVIRMLLGGHGFENVYQVKPNSNQASVNDITGEITEGDYDHNFIATRSRYGLEREFGCNFVKTLSYFDQGEALIEFNQVKSTSKYQVTTNSGHWLITGEDGNLTVTAVVLTTQKGETIGSDLYYAAVAKGVLNNMAEDTLQDIQPLWNSTIKVANTLT